MSLYSADAVSYYDAVDPTRARVSRNGQISLPAELRRRWGAGPQTEVVFVDHGDYAVVRPIPDDILGSLAGRYAGLLAPTDELRAQAHQEELEAEERKYGRLPDSP
jgi:bifunctional DNA-binding transcriptional regulator/antitoxin component of YhaV-PrlF toxin-antitoxin module